MPTISVKGYSGQELTYENVEKVYFNSPGSTEKVPFSCGDTAENVPIVLNLAEGDQTITAPTGTLVKSAIIAKPEDLAPENVRKGKNIAGVDGAFIGDTEERTVDLNMADGDQVIEPSAEGKVLSKVSITKPDTLIPANIAEGVDIAGIIGTLAAGGGGLTIAAGTISGTGAQITIEHGLGVVPDVAFAICVGGSVDATYHIDAAYGVSGAAKATLGVSNYGYYITTKKQTSSSSYYNRSSGEISTAIDAAYFNGLHIFHDADATSIVFGTETQVARSGYTYFWCVASGLT